MSFKFVHCFFENIMRYCSKTAKAYVENNTRQLWKVLSGQASLSQTNIIIVYCKMIDVFIVCMKHSEKLLSASLKNSFFDLLRTTRVRYS